MMQVIGFVEEFWEKIGRTDTFGEILGCGAVKSSLWLPIGKTAGKHGVFKVLWD